MIDECLSNESAEMRQAAATALTQLSTEYYNVESEATLAMRRDIVHKYTAALRTGNQTARMGCALALGQ